MAEIKKFPAHSVGRLMLHNNRSPDDGVTHSNEDIDLTRTHLNYHLRAGDTADLSNRLKEVFTCGRKNQVVLAEVVVTLPKDVKQKDEYRFFKAVFDFYRNDFGDRNVINAVVHKDEKTPHLHLDFVPVVKGDIEYNESGYGKKLQERLDKWKENHPEELERLACKELISQAYLRTMHERLSDFVEAELGYKTAILNGATVNGNKTVNVLKKERLEQENELLEQKKAYLEEDIKKLTDAAERVGIDVRNISLMSLLQTIDALRVNIKILQEIINRNNYEYSQDEFVYSDKQLFARSTNLNISNQNLAWAKFEPESIIISETYDRIARPQPSEALFKRDSEMWEALEEARQYRGRVYKKKLESTGNTILIVKSDNEVQTFEALLELERMISLERNQKHIYMGRLEFDKYDVGRDILSTSYVKSAVYYTGQEEERKKADAMERSKSK